MNSISLTGRITKDPEAKYRTDGSPYCLFTIAVDDGKDTEGNRKAIFVDCIASKVSAEFLAKYVKKGNMLAVTGSLNIREVEDSNGNRAKFTSVRAFNVENLTPRQQEAQAGATSEPNTSELPFEI